MTVTGNSSGPAGGVISTGSLAPLIPSMRASPENPVRDPGVMAALRKVQGRPSARPVTTLEQSARVAMHRTRRMTLLGQIPIVGVAVVPWLWPLHMFIVGRTADHIRHTRDAHLSFHDGRRPRRLRGSTPVAAAALVLWLLVLGGVEGLLFGSGALLVAWTVLVLAVAPAVIEFLGLVEFVVLNPEWVTIKRDRRRRGDGRNVIVLTSLVSRRDGHDYAGQLMDLEFPSWHAADALVIGYPGSKALISYYVRMGARREKSTPDRPHPARRRVAFDCRVPLRTRIR